MEKETRQTSLHFEVKMVLFNDFNGLRAFARTKRLQIEVNCVQMASICSHNGQIERNLKPNWHLHLTKGMACQMACLRHTIGRSQGLTL